MTNFNIELEFAAASFGRRLGAVLIDIVIIYVYWRICMYGLNFIAESAGPSMLIFISLMMALPIFCYSMLFETLMNGQTIGKKLTGIRVVNETGGQPSFSQFVIRWLIRTSDWLVVMIIVLALMFAAGEPRTEMLEFLAVPLLLFAADILLVNIGKKNQRLGDLLAATLVIRITEKRSIHETVFEEIEENYTPSFPQVMRLSDRDINSLKSILGTARKRQDFNLAAMAATKISNHLSIQTTLEPFSFLEVLLKDYNYLSAKEGAE